MDTFQTIASRRSVKKYDPDYQMTQDEITRLMEAVLLSPTSFNIQNWRFVLITDQSVQDQVKEVGYNQAQFSDSSMIVLICGDRLAFGRDTARYWANAGEEVAGMIVPMIQGSYGGNTELQRDENLRSGGIAGQTLMLAARAMGFDTCPMVGFDFAKVAEIVNLPADHDIVMAVTVGKALEPARERGGQLPLDEVVFHNSF